MAKTPAAPRLKVVVSQEFIDDAVPRDSGHCMIAEAVKAAFPDAKSVSVDLQTIRFTDRTKGLRYTYLTPRIGQVALVHWDDGEKPEPFDFTLRNGQVTKAGAHRATLGRELSPQELEKRRTATAKGRAKLVTRNKDGSVPDVVGGKTPPLSGHARRRAFGLRGLTR